MSNIVKAIYSIRQFDQLARQDSIIHGLHPLAKLLVTLIYTVALVSYDKYATIALLPFMFYPIFIATAGRIPAGPILKRLLYAEPMIICVGLLNPLFDHGTTTIGVFSISTGWLILISIIIKGSLAVTVALLLIATTSIEKISLALRELKVPKIFILQMVMNYRYITVLLEETARILQAHELRSPGRRGLGKTAWGPLVGQILLRTMDRAQRIYDAMRLRRFRGDFHPGKLPVFRLSDAAYLLVWGSFLILARLFNMPLLMGNIMTGVR